MHVMIKSLSLGLYQYRSFATADLIMGVFDYVCNIPRGHNHDHHHNKLKKKPNQTVEIKVKMDCSGCERRVRKSVEGMRGVEKVEVEAKQSKVRVTGNVEAAKVVQRVKQRTGKKAELWPYVPYDVVAHPYAPDAYDKKAPPGYVRNAEQGPAPSALARANSTEVNYTMAFSDDNPNACAIM